MGKKRLADNKDDMEEGEHSDMDKSSKIASRTANLVRENNMIPFFNPFNQKWQKSILLIENIFPFLIG